MGRTTKKTRMSNFSDEYEEQLNEDSSNNRKIKNQKISMAQSNTSINQYDDLRKEVAQRYEQLHPDLKTALVSVDTAGAVYEIGKKFGLDIEQTGYLADVIGYTIIGLLPVADFVYNLKDTIGIDSAKASEIAREVNNKIFLAIRARLKEMHGEKWDERAMLKQEVSITKSVLRDETTKQEVSIKEQEARTTPKSPWEIKPDGFNHAKMTPEKSVVPPQKTELQSTGQEVSIKEQEVGNEVKTIPPELPKTREVPQPAPMMRGAEVLREIRPAGATNELGITNKELEAKPTITIPTPPAGLPIKNELGIKPVELEIANKESGAKPTELRIMNKELGAISTIPDAIQQIPAQQKSQETPTPTQPQSAASQKYPIDPYREPIE